MSTTGRERHRSWISRATECSRHHATRQCSSSCWPASPLSRFQEFPPTPPDFQTLLPTATSRFQNFNWIFFRSR
ncbi:unnamed protein product [Brassica napus]|uniref:(rape) hypothetical protein n=1 Tax=Brassica napus TaxID=3708 RepID=A0A816U3S3_BRANA|nr:unnamed protein product [Brassica napus]